MSESPLILSIFPGIGLGEAEAFRCRDASVDHGVMVRAKYPDVFPLSVQCSRRSPPSPFLVVNINDSVLSAYGTGGKIQRYTVEEALRLQGLDANFFGERQALKRDAQLRVIANGVPLPMGRAVALAVKRAMYEAAA